MEKEPLLNDAVETSALLGSTARPARSYATAAVGTSQSRTTADGTVVFSHSLSHNEFPDRRPNDDSSTALHSEGSGEHCHTQQRNDDSSVKSARRVLIGVSVLCLVFMIGEIVGGVIANSLAIATDAAHLLSDLAGFLISLFAMYIASRPATTRMSFGWHRAEVMGAMISVLIIWVVTIVLVYMAVQRVLHPNYVIDAKLMLIMSLVSIFFNILMMLVLCIDPNAHGHSHGGLSHSHSHGGHDHSHQTKVKSGGHGHAHSGARNEPNGSAVSEHSPELVTVENGSSLAAKYKKANINVRAAIIHAVGDMLQSIGVFVAAMVIYFVPNAQIADPICTFVFSVLVMATTFNILRESLSVLMEAGRRARWWYLVRFLAMLCMLAAQQPAILSSLTYFQTINYASNSACEVVIKDMDYMFVCSVLVLGVLSLYSAVPKDLSFNEIRTALISIEGVTELHDLRLWSLTTNKPALSVHLAIDSMVDTEQVLAKARTVVHQNFQIYECTFQVERYVAEMDDCEKCQDPKE